MKKVKGENSVSKRVEKRCNYVVRCSDMQTRLQFHVLWFNVMIHSLLEKSSSTGCRIKHKNKEGWVKKNEYFHDLSISVIVLQSQNLGLYSIGTLPL